MPLILSRAETDFVAATPFHNSSTFVEWKVRKVRNGGLMMIKFLPDWMKSLNF